MEPTDPFRGILGGGRWGNQVPSSPRSTGMGGSPSAHKPRAEGRVVGRHAGHLFDRRLRPGRNRRARRWTEDSPARVLVLIGSPLTVRPRPEAQQRNCPRPGPRVNGRTVTLANRSRVRLPAPSPIVGPHRSDVDVPEENEHHYDDDDQNDPAEHGGSARPSPGRRSTGRAGVLAKVDLCIVSATVPTMIRNPRERVNPLVNRN